MIGSFVCKYRAVWSTTLVFRDEYGKLFEFAKSKNLRMKNIGNKKVGFFISLQTWILRKTGKVMFDYSRCVY